MTEPNPDPTSPGNPDAPVPPEPGEGEPGTQVLPPGQPPTADPYAGASAD